jgi:hypothetical protein
VFDKTQCQFSFFLVGKTMRFNLGLRKTFGRYA